MTELIDRLVLTVTMRLVSAEMFWFSAVVMLTLFALVVTWRPRCVCALAVVTVWFPAFDNVTLLAVVIETLVLAPG